MVARLRRDGALTAPNLTRRYLEAHLRGRRNEIFVAILLDSRHRPIAYETLFNRSCLSQVTEAGWTRPLRRPVSYAGGDGWR